MIVADEEAQSLRDDLNSSVQSQDENLSNNPEPEMMVENTQN